MKRSKWIWAVMVVVFLSCLIPYTLLTDVAAWYGSFLFWSLAGLVVIALNVYITKDFEEHDHE